MSNRQLHLQQSPQRLDDGKCGGGGATEILEFPTVAIPAPIASGGYLLIRRRKKGAVAQLTSYANQPPLSGQRPPLKDICCAYFDENGYS